MRKFAAALAALSLAVAPAAAQNQPPAPEPAPEEVEGSEIRGGTFWLLPAIIVVVLLIAITRGDEPESP